MVICIGDGFGEADGAGLGAGVGAGLGAGPGRGFGVGEGFVTVSIWVVDVRFESFAVMFNGPALEAIK
jgi:hypothetical protein